MAVWVWAWVAWLARWGAENGDVCTGDRVHESDCAPGEYYNRVSGDRTAKVDGVTCTRDGNGTCVDDGGVSCLYACNGSVCYTSCTSLAQCSSIANVCYGYCDTHVPY